MRTITPCYIKLSKRYLMPCYDCIDFWPLMWIYFACFSFHISEFVIMPEFQPTEWMLDNHRGKSEHDWEVYAECLREAMAKQGGFLVDQTPSIKNKLDFEEMMGGRTDEMTIYGKTFHYG